MIGTQQQTTELAAWHRCPQQRIRTESWYDTRSAAAIRNDRGDLREEPCVRGKRDRPMMAMMRCKR